MPLYIKDPEVDKLIAELVGLTGTSKIEAIKTALMHEIAHRERSADARPACQVPRHGEGGRAVCARRSQVRNR